jgi:protein-L-isoaspartate(D-aspartate) O-methyltransferase
VPDLVAFGAANLFATGMPWVHVEPAVPGELGLAGGAPYQRILVSAQASELPRELVRQLAPAGVLVIPVSGRMLRVRADVGGPAVEKHGFYRFVPLVADPPPSRDAPGPA